MQKTNKNNYVLDLLTIFVVYILINMVIFPEFYIKQTFDGISVWAINVLPSLLPFVFFSKILSSSNLLEKTIKIFAKPFQKLFKTPPISSYAFLSSIISGYPVGAKITQELYLSNKITRNDACKMLSFCSTSGPMFIIGAVGAGMFKNTIVGYIIFFSHILGAFINGLLYRNLNIYKPLQNLESNDINKKNIHTHNTDFKEKNNFSNKINLSSIILDTSLSVISVGTIIAIFYVVISSLTPLLSFLPENISIIITSLVEITRGCIDISSSFPLFAGTIITTFIISFGGISTMLQAQTMTNEIKVPIRLYLCQKLSHALISTIISFALCLLFL